MTTDQNVGEGVQGAGGEPSQTVSQTPQPIDGEVTKLLTGLGEQVKTLQAELRGLQGRQDKGEKNLTGFQEQLARYQQFTDKGMKPDEALAEMQRVDSFAEWQRSLETKIDTLAVRLGGIGTTPTEQQKMTEVLSQYGLDPKDPFVASKIQGKAFANELELKAFAGEVLLEKTRSPQPNAAQVATPAGAPPLQVDAEALAIEYNQLARNPTAHIERMREIRKVLDGIK